MKAISKILGGALAVGAIFFAAGCATPVEYFSAAPNANQKLVHLASNSHVLGVQEISGKSWVEVLFVPTAGNDLFNGMAVFWVYAKNIGTTPFEFGADSLSVTDKRGNAIPVLTVDKVALRLRGNKNRQEFAFIVASSFLSAIEAAPYSTVTQTGVYSGYTSSGQYVSGVTYTTAPNTTVEYLAQQQNSARTDTFSSNLDAAFSRAMANIGRLSLRPALLGPGDKAEGIIAVPLPNRFSLPNRFAFTVRAANDASVHYFTISSSAK